jgi:4-amino-4-deoxy-L-arabinose transferase-like glycosyltransferase
LLSWLPYLWGRVLCAGGSRPVSEPGRWSAFLLLLFLPGLLLYPCLFFPLFEPDESRYAEIPREMLQRGEWVVPLLQGEPYLDKPPLFYWCVMVAYRCFGVADGVARLVPALSLHGAILILYLLGRRTLGERAAFRGALLLALAPGFLGVGRLLLLDGLLTFFITLGLLAGFEAVRTERFGWGWWLLAALACALGTLTKGPIAVLLVLGPVVLHRLMVTAARVPVGAWVAFLALVAILNVPWYVAMCFRVPAFLPTFIWEHHLQRFFGSYAHEQGVFYYGPVLLLGLLPGTLLIVPFLRWLLTGDEAAAQQRTTELGFCLLAGGFCVGLFTLSTCKLATYILPAFPPLALALGYYLGCSGWNAARATRVVSITSFVLLMLAHHVVVPWYAAFRSPFRMEAEVARLCADPAQKVVGYPRSCDSLAFYLGRDDLGGYRSKEIEDLRLLVRQVPRVVILCSHRSSLQGLRELLPRETPIAETVHFGLPDVPLAPHSWQKPLKKALGETAEGLADIAVVQHPKRPAPRGDAEASEPPGSR